MAGEAMMTIRGDKRDATARKRRRFNVLIGEQDEPTARAIARALGHPPLDLHRARDAEEVVRIVSHVPIDLYFIDLDIPSLGGIATLKLIRQIRRPVRCVLTLDNASKEALLEAAENDAYSHIRKPIDTNEVRRVLGRFLSRFHGKE